MDISQSWDTKWTEYWPGGRVSNESIIVNIYER